MKTSNIFFLATVLLAANAFAGTIDLSQIGKTGRFCPGDTLSIDLERENNYVERMLLSAEGIRNDGFIKVYADGELVQNVGIPGYDPDYSFRIRRNVRNLSLKFENTCAVVRDGKIFTPSPAPATYHRYQKENVHQDNWGSELLEITRSLSQDLQYEPDFQNNLWPKVLLPMKKLALLESVSEQVRDERSSITAYRALKIAKIVVDNDALLDSLLSDNHFDYVVEDLLRIKEDILERYDVKKRDLGKKITALELELDIDG